MRRLTEGGYSRRTLGWIVGLTVFSFALALLLTAYADEIGTPSSPGTDTFSYSALGHRALVEFLESGGLPVTVQRDPSVALLGPTTPLVLVEPYPRPDFDSELPNSIAHLIDLAIGHDAPFILVLTKRLGQPDARKPEWLRQVHLVNPSFIDSLIARLQVWNGDPVRLLPRITTMSSRCNTAWGESLEVDLADAQLLDASDDLEPLVTCGEGILAARLTGDGAPLDLVLLADPDLLNNQGIGRADHALLVQRLFVDHFGSDSIVIDETVHGFVRSSGLLREMFRFPLAFAVIHGVLLIGLVLWAGLGRFGKPRSSGSALDSGRQVLIDNTAKLLNVAGHSHRSLQSYFRQTVTAVAAHYLVPSDLTGDRLLRRLDAIGRTRGVKLDLLRLKSRIFDLERSRRTHGERLVRLARAVHRWREEMTDDA